MTVDVFKKKELMENAIWFEGFNIIECNIKDIKKSFDKHGELFVSVVGLMPGLTSVDIIEEQENSIISKTSEGVMKCTNISKVIEDERIIIEFDEDYQAGKTIKVSSHYFEEFIVNDGNVKHRTVLSKVKAPGLLVFLPELWKGQYWKFRFKFVQSIF